MVSFRQFKRGWVVWVTSITTLACSLTAPQNPSVNTPPIGGADNLVNSGNAPTVILAAPPTGAAYRVGVPVNILARVENAGTDIARVEILVDGEIVVSLPSPNPMGAPVFTVSQSWVADGNGQRTLGVTVFRADGSNTPITRTIEVVGDGVQLVGGGAAGGGSTATGGGGRLGSGFNFSGLFGGTRSGTSATPTESVAPTAVTTVVEEEVAASPVSATDAPTATEAPTATTIPASATPNVPTATITVGANVRSGPGTEFGTIGSYPAGQVTEALAVNTARTWYKIRYYNGEGWISASVAEVSNIERLAVDDGPPPPSPTPVPPTAVPATAVPASTANLRFQDTPNVFDPFPPSCKQTMRITLRVENNGTSSLGSTSRAIVRDVHVASGLTTETSIPIPDIAAGTRIDVGGEFFLTVDTNFESEHRIEIILDVDGQIAEADENDNRFSGLNYTLARGSC